MTITPNFSNARITASILLSEESRVLPFASIEVITSADIPVAAENSHG
jgi:hypothetical protein